ncbi:unnamed protein product [Arctogadus glacialis]
MAETLILQSTGLQQKLWDQDQERDPDQKPDRDKDTDQDPDQDQDQVQDRDQDTDHYPDQDQVQDPDRDQVLIRGPSLLGPPTLGDSEPQRTTWIYQRTTPP